MIQPNLCTQRINFAELSLRRLKELKRLGRVLLSHRLNLVLETKKNNNTKTQKIDEANRTQWNQTTVYTYNTYQNVNNSVQKDNKKMNPSSIAVH